MYKYVVRGDGKKIILTLEMESHWRAKGEENRKTMSGLKCASFFNVGEDLDSAKERWNVDQGRKKISNSPRNRKPTEIKNRSKFQFDFGLHKWYLWNQVHYITLTLTATGVTRC